MVNRSDQSAVNGMKLKSVFYTFFLCFCFTLSFAQETMQRFLGIETGIIVIEGKMSNMDYVRGSISPYGAGNSAASLSNSAYRTFIGIKTEKFSVNNKLGFSAGIRFSRVHNSFNKGSYWTNSTNYFY